MLLRFAQDGNLPGVKRQVASGTSVNHTDGNGTTALMKACLYGKLDVVQFLYMSKASVNIQSAHGETAVMHAAEYGYLEIVQFLVETAKADITIKNDDGDTAKSLAKKAENHSIARYLSSMHDIKLACPERSNARGFSSFARVGSEINARREETHQRMHAFEEKNKVPVDSNQNFNSLEAQLKEAREKLYAASVQSDEQNAKASGQSSRFRRNHRRGKTVSPDLSSRSRSKSRSPEPRSPVAAPSLNEDIGNCTVASYEDYKATQKRIIALEAQIREAEETRKRVAALESLLNKSGDSRPGPPPLVHKSSVHHRGRTVNFSSYSSGKGGFKDELKNRAGDFSSHRARQRREENQVIRDLERRLKVAEEKLSASNRAKYQAEKHVSSLLSVSQWSAFSAEKKRLDIPGVRTLRMDVKICLDKRTNLVNPHLVVSVVSSKGVQKGRACEIPLEGSAVVLMGSQQKGVFVFMELKHTKKKKNFTKASTLGFAFFEAVP